MRPLGVVVGHVTAERVFEVASSEDQQPVETLGADDAARTAPRGQPALILPAPNVDASPSEGQGRLHAYRTTVAPRTAPSLSRGLLANGRVRGGPFRSIPTAPRDASSLRAGWRSCAPCSRCCRLAILGDTNESEPVYRARIWAQRSPGKSELEYVLARSDGEAEVAKARAQYLAGQITIQQFELVLNRLMR